MKKSLKKCKTCGKEFSPYRTTDKYCSFKCTPTKVNTKVKLSKPIAKVSKKRSQQNTLYTKLREKYLTKPEHRYCEVARKVLNKVLPATEIHHKKGRKGELLNKTEYWLAVSRDGHCWIHENPEKAYELGYLISSTSIENINQ